MDVHLSLRDKLIASGIGSEEEIREHLNRAHAMITAAPSLRVMKYNPLNKQEKDNAIQ